MLVNQRPLGLTVETTCVSCCLGACCSAFAASCSRLGDSESFVDAGAEASVGFIFVEEQSPAKTMVDTQAVATKATNDFMGELLGV